MPKVSVIIPVYNTEKYLEKCLNSVCKQTLQDIEIICIDDCSTDNSYAILTQYASEFSNIKIIRQDKNQGEAAARNAGLTIAEGEYIGFVDSDDWVDLNFYEKLYELAKRENSDIAKGNLVYVLADGKKNYAPTNNNIKKYLSKYLFYYDFTSAIYKNSFLHEYELAFPLNVRIGPDIAFLSEAISTCNTFSLMDFPNYYYLLRRPNSAMTQNFVAKDVEALLEVRLRMIENIEKSNEDYTKYLNHVLWVHLDALCAMAMRASSQSLLKACVQAICKIYNKSLSFDELHEIIKGHSVEFCNLLQMSDEKLLMEFFDKQCR